MRKTMGLGLGGKILNRQGREVHQGGIVFLNSSHFLLGVLGGEILHIGLATWRFKLSLWRTI
jgi:hypothetical protein